jgi:WD40 repeat protein
MKHKMFLIVAALVLLFLSSSSIRAAEITIDWRQKLDSGRVDDLHFMPGQEQFILTSGQGQNFTEIRSCDDGRILKSYSFGGKQFEFTPDSTKLIFMCQPTPETGELQIRNLADMNLLASYQPPKEEELPYSYYERIAVDPVRPFVYAIRIIKNGYISNGIFKRKILIYNSETLQPVGELTSGVDSSLKFSEIAVSKDGKYLAAMNYGDSKLTVWSLDTRKKIVDKFISDQNTGKFSEPAYIKFSELNTDKIFFTGVFYKKNNVGNFGGLCIFSISENKIIDSSFAIQPNSIGGNPKIYLFENETMFIASNGVYLNVLNLIKKKIELKKDILGVNRMALGNFNYHNYEKYFIGGGGELIDKFNYQPNTSVPLENPKQVIYPNPTTGIVNIPLNCINSSKYEIYNTSGRLLNSTEITGATNNLLTIDFSQYPAGMYSVNVYCGKTVSQYQVVRGE